MKKTILIGLAFLCVLVMDAISSSSSIKYLQGKKKIELSGCLLANQPRSVFSPIQAFLSISELNIDFLSDVGSIDVVVYDEFGNAVYQKTVDTLTENHLTIDISAWNPGNYEVRFIGSEDRFMYGEFAIY